MRKFLITSTAFAGHAIVLYVDNLLQLIDFTEAEMSEAQQQWILNNVPLHLEAMAEFIQRGKSLRITEADFEVCLDDFKRDYPYSRNTHLLPPIWDKMSRADQVRAVHAAKEYRRYCQRNEWYKPKIAAAWLKAKEYLNDWKKM